VHTLLLADDSVTIQRVIELTFAEEDVRVVAVSDGDEAIERLEAAPPDIVLADIGMPGRNGYEVARYVKQSPRLCHIPVVLLRGAFDPIDQVQAEEAGCDGILAKPFEPELVISRVQALLARPRSRPASFEAGPSAHIDRSTRDDSVTSVSSASSVVERSGSADANPWDRILISGQDVAPNIDMTARVDELDDYFDRLGAAFASRLDADIEWRSSTIAAESTATDTPDVPAAPPSAGSASPGGSAGVPALADRFAALLTTEHGESSRHRPPVSGSAASEDIVEHVTRRVLAQLAEPLVRQTVADLVSEIAERLVREEIERIKAAIK
jgi:CheY-like chemotaxis protein